MLNSKPVRIALAAATIGALAMVAIPGIYKFSSNDGVVNGATIRINSPITGTLSLAKELPCGTPLRKGEPICKIVNPRVDRAALNAMLMERGALDGKVKALDTRISVLKSLCESLEKNIGAYKLNLNTQIDTQLRQAEHRLSQERAENVRARKELESNGTLKERKTISERDYDKYEANLSSSDERIQQLEWRIKELNTVKGALEAGTFLGDNSHNDAPYSKQRIDNLVDSLSFSETSRDEAKARMAALDGNIAAEEKRLSLLGEAEIAAPADSIVWTAPAGNGASIAENSEAVTLLDRSSIFLDVAVSESQFANIKAGDKVRYRLMGGDKSRYGTVFALRGSGSKADQSLAAAIGKDAKRDFRIWIRPNPEEMDLSPENFYQVGRRVEVQIPRRWHAGSWLMRIADVF